MREANHKRITMKLLRETIRRLILESDACLQLNNVLQGAIDKMDEHDLEIVHSLGHNKLRMTIKEKTSGKTKGILKADKPDVDEGKCYGGYIVQWAKVEPALRGTGLGALLYDVALELVGGIGLIADRNSVSTDALRNWKYFKKSPDYDKRPLDDKHGSYTPDNKLDDCQHGSYFEHGGSLFANSTVVPAKYFRKHPLNQVVTKGDRTQPTIKCLQGLGRIRER